MSFTLDLIDDSDVFNAFLGEVRMMVGRIDVFQRHSLFLSNRYLSGGGVTWGERECVCVCVCVREYE